VKLLKELDDGRFEAFLLFQAPPPQMLKNLARGTKIEPSLFLSGSVSLVRADAQWQELDCHPCRTRTSGRETFLWTGFLL